MTLHRRSVTVRLASVAVAVVGATLLLAAPPLGLTTQAQTAGSGLVISGIADSPNQATAPVVSGIADAPSQPGPTVSGIADAPIQPVTTTSGIADAPAQPVAPVSGIADAPHQPATTSGIADNPNQPAATSGIAESPVQPNAPIAGIADSPNQPAATANSGIATTPGNTTPGAQTSGIAGIAEPGAAVQPSASGIAAPGQPEQYQGPARRPAGPPAAASKIPVRVQGPAYGRSGYYGPSRAGAGRGYAPVRQVAARAPIAQAPRLPNTGTGGLLETAAPEGVTPWLPALLLLSVLGLGGSAVFAVRRAR